MGLRSEKSQLMEEMGGSRTNFNTLNRSLPKEKWDRNSKMPATMMKRWFGSGPQIDAEITLLFKQDLMDVGHGKVTHWQNDKMGKLATIILCD